MCKVVSEFKKFKELKNGPLNASLLIICSGTCRQKSSWFLPSKSATQETVFTQTRANYRSIGLRRFRSLGQIRRFCRDHRLVSQLPKKPTIVNRSRARRSLGRFENILEIQISTPVVNSGGYKNSGQSSDASLVTERYEQRQLTDTSLRQSISDRETRQQVYCTTSVRIGYILINYVVRYIPAFV